MMCGLLSAGQSQFFTNYGPEDGLSAGSVREIIQDERGFLWLGTDQGLNRFDGKNFKVYRYDPQDSTSLPHDDVQRLARSEDGRLWITSVNGGLTMYDGLTDRFYDWQQLTGEDDPGLGHFTKAIHVHSNDSIYVGTADRGILLYLPNEGRSERIGADPGVDSARPPTRIITDRFNARWLWVLHGTNLLRFDTHTSQFVPHDYPKAALSKLDFKPNLHQLFIQEDSTMYLATWGGGVWHGRPNDAAWNEVLVNDIEPLNGSKNVVLDLYAAGPKKYFLATEMGLASYNPMSGSVTIETVEQPGQFDLPKAMVMKVFKDREGVLWIGTTKGLTGWDMNQNRFRTYILENPPEMPNKRPTINGVLEMGGELFIAMQYGQGLLRDPHRQQHFTPDPRYVHLGFYGLARTNSAGIVAFTDQGMFAVHPEDQSMTPVFEDAFQQHDRMYQYGVMEDRQGHLWMGRQGNGVYDLDPVTGHVEFYGATGPEHRRLSAVSWLQGIAEDATGNIWVSIENSGLHRISQDRQHIDRFIASELDWLPTKKVWDVAIDEHDRLWIGTNGEGIIVTPAGDPGGEGTFQLLRKQGLPSAISTVFSDRDGFIWAGGPSGLFRIDPRDLNVRRFDHTEGLRRSSFHHASITQHPSGLITIVPELGEFITVDPKRLRARIGYVNVDLNQVLINGEPLHTDTTLGRLGLIVLEHDRNFLEIKYGSIAMSMRTQAILQHHLEGYEQGPITTGPDGVATYNDLPPGEYRFVISELQEGTVKSAQALSIIIEPAVWQTWWFYLLVALAVLTAVYAFTRWRMGIMRDKERIRIDMNKRIAEVELNALRAQMNPHFLFNSLNSINRYIVHEEPRVASEYLTKFSRLMRSVLQNSEQQRIPLKDELEALKLYIEMEALRFKGKFVFNSRVELDNDIERVLIPPLLLQPYVENAIWHGLMHRNDEGGVLSLRVSREGEVLQFEVEDNGIGRKRAEELKSKSSTKRRSMGMRITDERLQLVRSMYEVETEVRIIDLYDATQKPSGTKVIIRMYKKPTHGSHQRGLDRR